MQGTMWKMSAAAAVIGVGFLVMFQVQRAMELSRKNKPENVKLEQYSAGGLNSGSTGSTTISLVSSEDKNAGLKKLMPAPQEDGWDSIKPAGFAQAEQSPKSSKSSTTVVLAGNSEAIQPWDNFGKEQEQKVKAVGHEQVMNADPWGDAPVEPQSTAQVSPSAGPWNQTPEEKPQALFGSEPIKDQPAKVTMNSFAEKKPEEFKGTNAWDQVPGNTQEPQPLPEFAGNPLNAMPLAPAPAPATNETENHQKIVYENGGTTSNPLFPMHNEPSATPPKSTPNTLSFLEEKDTFPPAPMEPIKPQAETMSFPPAPTGNIPNPFAVGEFNSAPAPSNVTPFPTANPMPQENPTFMDEQKSKLPLDNKPKLDLRNLNTQPVSRSGISNIPTDLIGDAIIHSGVTHGSLKPELKIDKIAPPKAMLGEAMVYSIVVRNIGTAPAHNVTIEDHIPKGSQLTGTIPRAQLKEKKLIWKFSKLDPNQEETIKVRIIPIEEGEIGSVTTVSFKTEIAAETRITSPKLNITMQSLEQAVVGENVLVVFNVKNVGEGDAAGVVLHSMLPQELNHQIGRDLEYEIGTLAAGETKEVRLALNAVNKGIANISAKVDAKGGITATTKNDIEVIESILLLTRKGPSRRFVGRDATYSMLVENLSVKEINQIVIKEVVPIGLTYISSSSGGVYNPNNRLVTWTIPRLAGKGSIPLDIKLQADTVGDLESVVQATDKEGHQATIKALTKVEGFAQLGIREVNGHGPITLGEKASYSFHVANRGSATATNVKFVCIIPENMKFMSAKGPVRYQQIENKIVFEPIGRLDPNSEEKFELELSSLRQGEVSMQIAVSSTEMQIPVSHTESIIVYQE